MKTLQLQCALHNSKAIVLAARTRRAAFSLIELLVSIGVVAVLISLAVPALRSSRNQAKFVQELSKVRQIGIATFAYTVQSKDIVPTIFRPVFLNIALGDPWQQIRIGGTTVEGAWFMDAIKYHYLLGPLPTDSVLALGAPKNVITLRIFGAQTAFTSDYEFSNSFYATPDYWTRDRQTGPNQWQSQRISDVAFPSAKGMIFQSATYPGPDGTRSVLGFGSSSKIIVLWADGSANQEQYSELTPGVPNNWFYGMSFTVPGNTPSMPLSNTEFGVLGRDR